MRTDYYPARAARRDRRASTTTVYAERQQRRLSRRLRHARRPPTKKPSRASFATLDRARGAALAPALSRRRQITEADWRLFTTLVRFDAVYYSHFKCNLRRIVDYPNLWNYLRELYQVPGVAETVSLDHIKRHYYGSHRNINPTGIVPIGPLLDFTRRTTAAASAERTNKRANKNAAPFWGAAHVAWRHYYQA